MKRAHSNNLCFHKKGRLYINHSYLLILTFIYRRNLNLGSRDGAVARARASNSHKCGSGLIPAHSVICELSLLLLSRPCFEGFSPDSPVFLPTQKPTLLNSTLIGNSECHRYVSRKTVKCNPHKIKLIYLFILTYLL